MNELETYANKSTTVRTFYKGKAIRTLERLQPELTLRLLTRLFLAPRRRKKSARMTPTALEQRLQLPDGHEVRAWVDGEGPLVFLVHGWEGSSGQMSELIGRLLATGHRVAWFDAPGHGEDSARQAHVAQFAQTLFALRAELGVPRAVIAHSLGGLAATIASRRGLGERRLILLAPLPSFDFALDHFQALLGFSRPMREALAKTVEGITGMTRLEASMDTLLQRAGGSVVLVHDRDDQRIPVVNSRLLATKLEEADYVETRGLGHSRLLTAPALIELLTDCIEDTPNGIQSLLRPLAAE